MSENEVNSSMSSHAGLPPRPFTKEGVVRTKKAGMAPAPPTIGSPGKALRRQSREKIVRQRQPSNNDDIDDPLDRATSIFTPELTHNSNRPTSGSLYQDPPGSGGSARPTTAQRMQADASADRVAHIAADLDRILPRPSTATHPSTASSRQAARVQSTVSSIVPPRPAEYTSRYSDSKGEEQKRYRNLDTNSVLKASMKEDALLSILGAQKEAGADALLVAAEKGDYAAVTASLEDEVDPNECFGMDMYTPLHHAANRGHIAVIRKLLENGADVNRQNKTQETALHLAAYNGNLTVVELLLDSGANINGLNEDGETPLFFGARKNHPAVVRLLLQRGADAAMASRYGDLALDEATQPRTREAFQTEKVSEEGLATLGHDRVLRVFSFLTARELGRAAQICGRWHRVAEHDSLWKALGVRRWEMSLNASLGLAATPMFMAGMNFLRPRSGGGLGRPSSRSSQSSNGSGGGASRPGSRPSSGGGDKPHRIGISSGADGSGSGGPRVLIPSRGGSRGGGRRPGSGLVLS